MNDKPKVAQMRESDPEVKDRVKLEILDRKRELHDLKEILSTPNGKRFIRRLLEHCNLYTSTFTGTSKTYYLDGKRDVGHWILADLQTLAESGDIELSELVQIMLNVNIHSKR